MSDFPSLNVLKRYSKNINNLEIKKSQFGYYISFKEKLTILINQLVSKEIIKKGEELQIRVCADGVQVGRIKNLFNINFAILNDANKCKSPHGQYSLGIFEIREKREAIEMALKEIVNQLNITVITIDSVDYNIDFTFGGDLKCLAFLLGINGANVSYCSLNNL